MANGDYEVTHNRILNSVKKKISFIQR